MARALKASVLLASAFAAAIFFFPAPLASWAASRACGLSIHLSSAHWTGWGRLAYRDAAVAKDGEGLLRTSFGEALLETGAIRVFFEEASLEPVLWKRLFRGIPVTDGDGGASVLASGWVQWKGKKLEKAELDLIFSEAALAKLPEAWTGRLAENGGRRTVRCEFKEGEITLHGSRGPLLRASWEMVY